MVGISTKPISTEFSSCHWSRAGLHRETTDFFSSENFIMEILNHLTLGEHFSWVIDWMTKYDDMSDSDEIFSVFTSLLNDHFSSNIILIIRHIDEWDLTRNILNRTKYFNTKTILKVMRASQVLSMADEFNEFELTELFINNIANGRKHTLIDTPKVMPKL